MMHAALALLLAVSPAPAGDGLFALYASGQYDAAMRAGAQAGTAAGLALAARAALADAAMKPQPCLACLKRAADYARGAMAAGPQQADGHVWLAAALGLQARIIGPLKARLADMPAQAKSELDASLKDDPRNPYALAALGGWNIEIVRAGGAHLGKWLYGANEADGLALFDRAEKAAPGNVAVRYQIALSLSGYDPGRFSARIRSELEAALRAPPQTAYERFIQGRAGELLALLKKNAPDTFDAKVRQFQGYP